MSHDPHLGFVAAAYALAFVIVAGMIVTIVADYLNLKQALSSFAARERSRNPELHVLDMQKLNHRAGCSRNPDPESLP